MRIFISYAREDKAYCIQIAEALAVHEVWYDTRMVAGQDWWEEIQRRLEWCEAFVYLLSPLSVKSPYCRDEMLLALNRPVPVFPVLIQPGVAIPEEIMHLQYADMSLGMDLANGAQLLNAIYRAEIDMQRRSAPPQEVPGVSTSSARRQRRPSATPPPTDGEGGVEAIIGLIADALEEGLYENAHALITRAIQQGVPAIYVDLEELKREAEIGIDKERKRRQMEHEYSAILQLVSRARTRAFGCRSFELFHHDNPDYDPEDLAALCGVGAAEMPAGGGASPEASVAQVAAPARFSLPMLEWCDVPDGQITVEIERGTHHSREVLGVPGFAISRYPVTNAQFQLFVDDPEGFASDAWWDFSPKAALWREANPEPMDSKFVGDDRPREMVNWYTAVAFTRWLSARLGYAVTLPLRQQWMRAARGDDDRIYPWGDEFSTSLCNTTESKLHQTSQVVRFVKAASPFGVYDMAGNVWEWCLNKDYEDYDISADRPRLVQGGSYMSTHSKAQIGAFMMLVPDTCFSNIGFRLTTSRRT